MTSQVRTHILFITPNPFKMTEKRINHTVGTSKTGLAAVKNDKGQWVSQKTGKRVKIDTYRLPRK